MTYKQITEAQTKTFEQQKMIAAVGQSQMTDEQKSQKFSEAYKTLTDLNYTMLNDSFEKIITPENQTVVDKQQIQDFIANANTTLITEMQEKMIALRAQAQVKPIRLKATEEQIKKGAPVSFEVPLTFDNSNFFV